MLHAIYLVTPTNVSQVEILDVKKASFAEIHSSMFNAIVAVTKEREKIYFSMTVKLNQTMKMFTENEIFKTYIAEIEN